MPKHQAVNDHLRRLAKEHEARLSTHRPAGQAFIVLLMDATEATIKILPPIRQRAIKRSRNKKARPSSWLGRASISSQTSRSR